MFSYFRCGSKHYRSGQKYAIKFLSNDRTFHRYDPLPIIINYSGIGMMSDPEGFGSKAFHSSAPSSYFSTNEYITTDYNWNADLHKVPIIRLYR